MKNNPACPFVPPLREERREEGERKDRLRILEKLGFANNL